MMNKLLSKLHEKKLVKTLDDEESWNQLRIYDFVEIQGKFKPNPLSDSLNKINKMLDLAIKIAPLTIRIIIEIKRIIIKITLKILKI